MGNITWEVIGWEWIFHFIDIGLKLVDFELIKTQTHVLQRRVLLNNITNS